MRPNMEVNRYTTNDFHKEQASQIKLKNEGILLCLGQ